MPSTLVAYKPNPMPTLGADRVYLQQELARISNAIQVNAAALVAPDTVWHPLAYVNSWANYGAPYGPCGYRKLSSGLVVLRGLCQGGTASTIATLPAGYRPGIQGLFNMQTSPNVACRIDISTAGVISHQGGNAGWIALNGITFLAEL